MNLKLMLIVAASSLVLATSAQTASAHRVHRGHHHVSHHARHHAHAARSTARRHASGEPQARAATPGSAAWWTGGGAGVVARARGYLGATARQLGLRRTLWCSAFARMVAGDPAGTDDRARSWLNRPRTGPRVGAAAVLRRGHHVGFVAGFDARGNPEIISGNHNGHVALAVYPRSSVVAYVQP